MNKNLFITFYIIIQLLKLIDGISDIIEYVKPGGYLFSVCINKTDEKIFFNQRNSITKIINCWKMNDFCKTGNFYKCYLICNFDEKVIQNDKTVFDLKQFDTPIFIIPRVEYFQNRSILTISVENKVSISSILSENFKINFSDNGVICKQIWNKNQSINCLMHLKMTCIYYRALNVSILINYGNSSCNQPQNLGFILVRCGDVYFFILIIILVISIIGIFVTLYIKSYKRKLFFVVTKARSVEIIEEEIKNIKLKKMAFLDYQTTQDSFNTFGRLNIRILLPLNVYLSRYYNIEIMKTNENDYVKNIERLLLNKEKCFKFLDEINENQCLQYKNKHALLITLILFRHPKYFLTIMKNLIFKLVSRAKLLSKERDLFTKCEDIAEILIENWITLCMYYSFKHDDVGKRFFNLFRALKLKLESGIIDTFTNKARYCLSYDQLFIGSLSYSVLSIEVDVQIQLELLNSDSNSWRINLPNLEVDVLSLDSISQVKAKILDKAIMEFSELEDIDITNNASDYAIKFGDSSVLLLYLILNSAQLLLDDFDQTNEIIKLKKEFIQINTLQHYEIKNNMKFCLRSNFMKPNYQGKILTGNQKVGSIHIIENSISASYDSKLRSIGLNVNHSQKIKTDLNKESCFMFLLATKKSILPFIDGLVQSILIWKSDKSVVNSLNSLFGNDIEPTSDCLKNNYLNIVYYFFSMLDDVAKQLITDDETIHLWKSKSLILRFWSNVVKSPDSIFSMDKSEYIYDSLEIIGRLFVESSSIKNTNITIHSSIIQQLFHEEIQNKYSFWWQSFVNSRYDVEEYKIIEIMNNLVEKEELKKYTCKID